MRRYFLSMVIILVLGNSYTLGTEYIIDGGFEGFGATTLPDVGVLAGAWKIAGRGPEPTPESIQIELSPGSTTDYALHLSGQVSSGFYAAGQSMNVGQVVGSRLSIYQQRYIASAGSLGGAYTIGSGDLASTGSHAAMVVFGNNTDLNHIMYYKGGYQSMAPFSEGNWYELRIDVNTEGRKYYDCYLRSSTDTRYETWTQIGYQCQFVGAPSSPTWYHQIGNFPRSYADDVYIDNVSATDNTSAAGTVYFASDDPMVIEASTNGVFGNYQELDTIINSGTLAFSATVMPSGFSTTGSSSMLYLGDSRIAEQMDFDTGVTTENWSAAAAAFGFEQTESGLKLRLLDGAGDGTVAQTFLLDAGLQNDQLYRIEATVQYAKRAVNKEGNTWGIQIYDTQNQLVFEQADLGFLSDNTSILRLASLQNSSGTESVTFDDISLTAAAPTYTTLSPVGVVSASGEVPAGYEVEKLYDNDFGTFSVIRDDTLDGTSDTTSPAYGSVPITGHLVFDLGEATEVNAVELVSRCLYALATGPKDVDFFYYADDDPSNNVVIDDIEGDEDIILLASDIIDPIINAQSWITEWSEVTKRYIGMRVNDSYADSATSFNFQLSEVAFLLSPEEEEPIPGDANKDGRVDGSDVTILAGNWQVLTGASWSMGDFNSDGKVDGSDVTILAGNWQAGVTTAAASVPEPSTGFLLLMLLLSLIGIHFRK